MLFEMIFLLDSYSRRSLKFFGWYGLSDTFTKPSSRGLSCVFVLSSLKATIVDGSIFAYLTIAHAPLRKHCYLWLRAIISLVLFHMVGAGAYGHKMHDIHVCAFAVQTK